MVVKLTLTGIRYSRRPAWRRKVVGWYRFGILYYTFYNEFILIEIINYQRSKLTSIYQTQTQHRIMIRLWYQLSNIIENSTSIVLSSHIHMKHTKWHGALMMVCASLRSLSDQLYHGPCHFEFLSWNNFHFDQLADDTYSPPLAVLRDRLPVGRSRGGLLLCFTTISCSLSQGPDDRCSKRRRSGQY